MGKMSTSFTLGKASQTHGANVEHNNRKFIAGNVNVNKIADNITYVKQDIGDAYDELFGEALNDYNNKQKQPCRKINDYYKHITDGKREEAFYELVVQFGNSDTAPVGSENGELVKKMLDEYIKGFKARNPNLYIFNAVLHLDEASPHLHINFIPFYTKRKNGLSKGVSMKSALIEQGFNPKGMKSNQLILWEENERGAMEKILVRNGLERDVKNADYTHQSVNEYKEAQDAKKLSGLKREKISPEELAEENIRKIKTVVSALQSENKELREQKYSPYKSFFYSSPEKQSYVQDELTKLGIPYRETENGFEAQECYVTEIRKLEKEFKPVKNPNRDTLRDDIDKFIMQSKKFDEVLEKLKTAGYEIKQGKYLSVKPKYSGQFIRIKSLGEDYSEQALKNRYVFKQKYESDIEKKIGFAENLAGDGRPDALDTIILKTIRHYTVVFAGNVLPANKKNKNKPFMWTNDAELDKLSELNKKINAGLSLETLRNSFKSLEESVAEKEKNINELKTELNFFNELYEKSKLCFDNPNGSKISTFEKEQALKLLTEHRITSENFRRIEKLIAQNEKEITETGKSLSEEREKLKDLSETLDVLEKIAGGTYVQSLIDAEKNRRQSEIIPNGLKRADEQGQTI
jgi:hypothetical protein